MKLHYPVKPWAVTQGFGANANASYSSVGLVGHTGIDVVAPYDTPIYPAQLSPVYRAINFGAPIRSYRCVYQIIDDTDFSYELSYGHCNKQCSDGRTWEPLATMGNSGDVYVNGKYVEPSVRDKPPYPGTHLHFQVRKLVRTTDTNMGKNDKNGRVRQFIYQSNGNLFTRNGFAYEIEDYWNGYNGCIDPAPFFTGEYAVDQKLKPMLESLVELLQELISKLQKK